MKAWTAAILSAALLLPFQETGAEAPSETTLFEKRSHAEVVRLHEMIEAWLAGSILDTDATYLRFSDAMAEDFEIISPSCSRSDRQAIVSSFRAAHGSRGPEFSVAIKNIRTRLLSPPLALLTYEEWQYEEGRATARFSTVLLRDEPSRPGGVAWVHLQETWLPGLSPIED